MHKPLSEVSGLSCNGDSYKQATVQYRTSNESRAPGMTARAAVMTDCCARESGLAKKCQPGTYMMGLD